MVDLFEPTEETIANIKSEVVTALAGAEYIREKLYSLFDVGPNPLSRIAYAVKIRVKSDDRLIQKVLARRLDGKPNYKAADATDIVGVRLVAVYSDELLDICRRLLEVISLAQTSNIQIITGDKLDDCVQEIIVFTSKDASYVYDLLYKEFLTLNLGQKEDGKPKVTSIKSPDKKPYSSVHIVLNAISYSAKSPKIIPIEIQLRTIFEDTWAEIDHPLQYKGVEFQSKIEGKPKQKPEYARLREEAQRDVRLLKDQLDVISHEADNIRERFITIEELFGQLESIRTVIPFSITYIRYNASEFYDKNTPVDIRAELDSLNELITRYYEEMFPGKKSHLNEYIRKLTEVINRTGALIESYSEGHPARFRKDAKARYFLFMEKALALLWRYRIVNHFKDAKAIGFQFDVNEAIKIYCELDTSGEFPDDPMIVFRLANTIMVKGGHIDYVIKLLETANERLAVSQRIRKGDLFRAWIPRQYAYALWRKKQYFDNEFATLHNVRLSAEYKADLLRKALDSTERSMFEAAIFTGKIKLLEDAKNWNNWISYLWELIDLSGVAELRRYATRLKELRGGIKLVKEIYNDGIDNINGLDSLTKAFDLLGDTKQATSYRARLRKALSVDNAISSDDRLSVQYTLDTTLPRRSAGRGKR